MAETEPLAYAALDLDYTQHEASLLPYCIQEVRLQRGVPLAGELWVDPACDPYVELDEAELHSLPKLIQGQPVAFLDPGVDRARRVTATKIYPHVHELIARLHGVGLRVVALTMSPAAFADASAQVIGGIDRVIASELVVRDGRFTGEIIPLNKLQAIGQLARQGYESAPTVAVGDSMPDLEMLQLTAERGGHALAFCLTDVARDSTNTLHRTIHQLNLPITVFGWDSMTDELLRCHGPLPGTDDWSCDIRTTTLDQLLTSLNQ